MGKNILKVSFIILLILFIMSYFISFSGYYEYEARRKMVITSDRIKEFEEDIKNNENIDVKDYLNDDVVDYSNKITDIVYNISSKSNDIAKKTIKYLFKRLGSLVDE